VPRLKGIPCRAAMPRRSTKSVCATSTTSSGANVIVPSDCEISTMHAGVAFRRYQTRWSHMALFAAAASPRSAKDIMLSSLR